MEQDWKNKLTPEEFYVCRQKGTEPPFSGKYCDNKETGIYTCKCCGEILFKSDAKFNSGTGWPSFYDVAEQGKIKTVEDLSHGMKRVEILCNHCGSHLGHVFEDGPKPTGLRYCVNSLSLDFSKK